ncbi:MAG: alpha-mannosidase [Oscillospiraceae bacterium]|jgi:alpha-mannosidase|nr:alpha-mannosidase [Oscillospiraceae bacterium]
MNSEQNIHLIGNAHLDPIWLWRWQEGCGEVLQTFRSALDRLKEYNDLVFTCSSASYYRWVEEIDPEMFAEITKMVKLGRWVPVNGWWVQPDCNMPSGESFARQALYSQLYYYEKFGKICRTGYNVDSFGHNGMMPQLLRQGGMHAYVMMRPHPYENPDAPENAFWWDSMDGSRVLTYRIPRGYADNGKEALDATIADNEKRMESTGHGMMLFYGIGNHGGGPTRGDIEYLKDLQQQGFNLEFSSPDDFFNEMMQTQLDLPVWEEDLQHHASGCYSATSLVKQLNRKAENWLAAAEKWNTIAAAAYGADAKTADFAEAWREVCFNQFHDILCGCSIMEAYEDVKETMGFAMSLASKAYNTATLKIARNIDTWIDGVSDPVCTEVRHHQKENRGFPRPVVVFNPLSWEIEVPVRTYHPSRRAEDSEGNPILFQNVRSSRSNDSHLDTVFMARVPAFGYATYWLWFTDGSEFAFPSSAVQADAEALTIENEHIKVTFDKATGAIASLVGKEDGFDYVSPAGSFAVPTVIDDHVADTWAHKIFKFHDIKGLMELASIELVESGPVRAVVRVKHTFGKSTLSQDFILAAGQKTFRVKCKALWHEDFTMLKFAFKMDGSEEISTYEIPCGYIKRPCNGEEEPALNWADLTLTAKDGSRRGVAVMSDSKYSYDCPETELRLTALRNVIFADHFSPRPPADFNFTDEGLQRFEYGIMVHSGEAETTDVMRESAYFNCRPVAVPESYHKGSGASQVKSYLDISVPNVVVTAFKYSEDGSGAQILRLYETMGKKVRAKIMLLLTDIGFWADIGAHQIKTFRIEPDGYVKEVTFLEGIVR